MSSESEGQKGAERQRDPARRSAPPPPFEQALGGPSDAAGHEAALRGAGYETSLPHAGREAALRLAVALAESHRHVYRRVLLSSDASVADAAVIAHNQARRLKLAPNAFLTAANSDGGQALDLFAALNALDLLAIEYVDGNRSVKGLRERAAELGLAWHQHGVEQGQAELLAFSYGHHRLHAGHYVSVAEERRQSQEPLRVHIALSDGRPDGPELGMYVGTIDAPSQGEESA